MVNDRSLFNAMIDLNENRAEEIVKCRVEEGIQANSILKELQDGMLEIGKRFEREEYFVPDLIFAGEIMKEMLSILTPHIEKESVSDSEKVIIGTVFGDVHDIGKDIVVTLLRGVGFEVIDLGVNVKPEQFVEAIRETGAKLVGMSALLTISFRAMSETVNTIEKSGLRDQVSIMAGGSVVTELACKKIGCDFYGKDAFEGIKIAQKVFNLQGQNR